MRQGGHAVPEDKIVKRYHLSLGLLMQAIRNTDRAYIFDNSGEGQERTWLAEVTEGRELEMTADRMPAWFKHAVWEKLNLGDGLNQKCCALLLMKIPAFLFRQLPLALFVGLALTAWALPAAAYDPLALPEKRPLGPLDFTVHDAKRNRDIPIRVFLPTQPPRGASGVSLGTWRCARWCSLATDSAAIARAVPIWAEHWAARGYAVVYVQHPGSDDGVWKDVAPVERMAALTRAASPQNFFLRVQDIPAVLDQLAIWNKEAGHALLGRLDLTRTGMCGHSFGAVTTQAVGGQSFPGDIGQRMTDPTDSRGGGLFPRACPKSETRRPRLAA